MKTTTVCNVAEALIKMVCFGFGLSFIILAAAIDANLIGHLPRQLKPQNSQTDTNAPETGWFEQILDHQNISNTNTWKQRYYVRKEFYQQGGPAFLFLEGEYEAFSGYLDAYVATDYAKTLKGIMFNLEHRYFGQSRPTSDITLENLRHMSIEQALEDIAYFIAGMNSQFKLPQGTKWIVLGTSYAGNLAVWARAKFPHLVSASVGYSAPVQPKLNFWEYMSVVRDVIKAYDKDCLSAIQQGNAQLKEGLLKPGDPDDVVKKFKLCDPVDQSNRMDVLTVIALVAGDISRIIQYKNRWPITLKDTCDIMANTSLGDFIDRYAKINTLTLEATSTNCVDFKYDKYIKLKTTNLTWESSIAGEHPWGYELCTEIGGFQTSYQKTHLFSDDLPLDFFIQQCTDIFGKQFTQDFMERRVARTILMYGGLDVKATRVAFVNGEEDPWMTLGITSTRVPESPAILVKGEAHEACAYGVSDSAPEEVKAACQKVKELIFKWASK